MPQSLPKSISTAGFRDSPSRVIIPLLVIILLFPSLGFPQTLEEKVKSVFIYKFSRFIKWPQSIKSNLNPKVIGVVGDAKIKAVLSSIILDQKDSSLLITSLKGLDVGETVDIIYVPKEAVNEWNEKWNTLNNQELFTICDGSESPSKGCMIDFVKKDGKIAFNLNLGNIRDSKLNISAHIMKVANKVWK